jgi:hypothetical protein
MENPKNFAFSLASLSTLPSFMFKEDEERHREVVRASERQAVALGFTFKWTALAALTAFIEAHPNSTAAELLNALQAEVERGALPANSAVVIDRVGALTRQDLLYLVGAMAQLQAVGVRLIVDGQVLGQPVDVEHIIKSLLPKEPRQ